MFVDLEITLNVGFLSVFSFIFLFSWGDGGGVWLCSSEISGVGVSGLTLFSIKSPGY